MSAIPDSRDASYIEKQATVSIEAKEQYAICRLPMLFATYYIV